MEKENNKSYKRKKREKRKERRRKNKTTSIEGREKNVQGKRKRNGFSSVFPTLILISIQYTGQPKTSAN